VAGIGLELQYGGGFLYVESLANSGPAARAGIQLHDRILRIDDVDVRRLGVEEASLRLLGRENTIVTLDVQGVLDLGPRVVEIPRERLSQPSLGTVRLVDPELGIGYVHLGLFQPTTLFELDNALDRLLMEGLRALILDLRGNPGGSFESAVQVADRFLLAGIITSTRGRSPGTTAIHRVQDDRAVLIPLVLLIDGETASAAEILASALRDHRRARLVGQPTAGKGSIQMVFPLKTVPSGLRLTAARYWSPLEMAINDNPIQPDVLVDGSDGFEGMEGMMSTMQLQQRQFEAALVEIRNLLLKAGMP
jgi:carboxyl-terminal processing protease